MIAVAMSAAPPSHGPLVQALDDLWQQYAQSWKRLLSAGMLKELVLRASFNPEPIPAWKVANTIPKGTIPDCPTCTNICCAGLENVVSLRLRDIAMLIDLGRTDLMTKLKPNFPAWMLQDRPLLKELVASELWRALPVMRQVGSLQTCAALNLNTLQCDLHPHWPTTCERFPYTLNVAQRQVNWGTRCPSKHQSPTHLQRSESMFRASIEAYNHRVRDAVLLAHARPMLAEMGLGDWITGPDEDPFEARPRGLDIIR